MKRFIHANSSSLPDGDKLAANLDQYLKSVDLAAEDVWCDYDDDDEMLLSAEFRSWRVADLACEKISKEFVPKPDSCEVSDTSEFNLIHLIYEK